MVCLEWGVKQLKQHSICKAVSDDWRKGCLAASGPEQC